jgi:hypothetical protein
MVDHGGPFSIAAHSNNDGKIRQIPNIIADRTSYFSVRSIQHLTIRNPTITLMKKQGKNTPLLLPSDDVARGSVSGARIHGTSARRNNNKIVWKHLKWSSVWLLCSRTLRKKRKGRPIYILCACSREGPTFKVVKRTKQGDGCIRTSVSIVICAICTKIVNGINVDNTIVMREPHGSEINAGGELTQYPS